MRFLQLKNPWSHLRWKGRYCERDDKNWTPELLKYLNFDPKTAQKFDNGIRLKTHQQGGETESREDLSVEGNARPSSMTSAGRGGVSRSNDVTAALLQEFSGSRGRTSVSTTTSST